ncbi:MAG: ATP synthase F0 subunit C [Clostridia bacterium]|nr:ATP synthase F0 subunit C [Clostridia bacterium]
MKNKGMRILLICLTLLLTGMLLTAVASAETATDGTVNVEVKDDATSAKAIAAAIAVELAAAAGALGMGIAIAKSAESMARQPEAAGKINSAMMLGLVFIETAIIYGLIVAILIIFVL